MRWAGNVLCVGETRILYKILVGKHEGKGHPVQAILQNVDLILIVGSVLFHTLFDVERKLRCRTPTVQITVQSRVTQTSIHCEPLTLKGLRRGTARLRTDHTFCSSKGYFPNIGRQRGMWT
jgi:hypothetical protein